jgi:error-prone DNA polymerase
LAEALDGGEDVVGRFGPAEWPRIGVVGVDEGAYASSWLKRWHPTVFAAAPLNSQPMCFYAPSQIVRDAEEHGGSIRPVDVNASDWDSALEPEVRSAEGFALRLGLRLVSGLSAEDGRQFAQARRRGNGSPFATPEEVVRRTGIGRKAMESLAKANAFASMGASRRSALWAARGGGE